MNGLCACGCGKKAPIASYSSRPFGWVKGEPKKFIHGHNGSRRKEPNACITAGAITKVVIGDKVALIDSADLERVGAHRWFLSGKYVRAHINRRMVYLHRFILEAQPGAVVDHISRDTLDNRRANIRAVTQSVNMLNARRNDNKTGFRGVYYHPTSRKYLGTVQLNHKKRRLGWFSTAEQASAAVQSFLVEHGYISA